MKKNLVNIKILRIINLNIINIQPYQDPSNNSQAKLNQFSKQHCKKSNSFVLLSMIYINNIILLVYNYSFW